MTGSEYQISAMRTKDRDASDRLMKKFEDHDWNKEDLGGVIEACLGLSGEVGELTDMVKKWFFHDTTMDLDHLKKELGDVMWYVALLCDSVGWNLDDVMQTNVDKLKERYPEGFSIWRANHRKDGDV